MLPLAGKRVLCWTMAMAGPYGGMVFSELGAEVIHIDRPGPRTSQIAPDFARNKRSIAIDMRQEEGIEIMTKLIESADVLLESFSLGAAGRMGFPIERVFEINPKIIYTSVKGYGDGPYERRPAYDPDIEAETGVLRLQGMPDGEPVRHPMGQTDKRTGAWAAFAAILALMEREKTGKGQYIKCGMYEDSTMLTSRNMALYQLYGELLGAAGSGGGATKYFETLNWWVYLGVRTDEEWMRFCDAFNVSTEDAKAFKTGEARHANPEKLEKIIQDIFHKMTSENILTKLAAAKVPHTAVKTPREVIADPHLNAIKHFVLHIPGGRDRKTPMPIPMLGIRTSDYNPDAENWGGFPEHSNGQDTVEILRELEYTEDQITDLRKRKVVWPFLEVK